MWGCVKLTRQLELFWGIKRRDCLITEPSLFNKLCTYCYLRVSEFLKLKYKNDVQADKLRNVGFSSCLLWKQLHYIDLSLITTCTYHNFHHTNSGHFKDVWRPGSRTADYNSFRNDNCFSLFCFLTQVGYACNKTKTRFLSKWTWREN